MLVLERHYLWAPTPSTRDDSQLAVLAFTSESETSVSDLLKVFLWRLWFFLLYFLVEGCNYFKNYVSLMFCNLLILLFSLSLGKSEHLGQVASCISSVGSQ